MLIDFFNDFIIDSVFVIDIAGNVALCDNFAAELGGLFVCVCTNVAGTGNDYAFSFKAFTFGSKHLFCEIAKAETGRFGSCKAAAIGKAFSGKGSGPFVADAFILAEHISDLSCAGSDVACGNVGIGADVAVKLGHKTLAKAHDLKVGFAAGVKIASAFAAAHRKACKAVFKDLFEAKEFDYGSVYGRMKADSAFVGADCGVELNTVTAVDLNFSGIIDPGHTELDKTFRFDNAFHNSPFFNVGVLFNNWFERNKNFFYSLKKFFFSGVSFFNFIINLCKVFAFKCHLGFPPIKMI